MPSRALNSAVALALLWSAHAHAGSETCDVNGDESLNVVDIVAMVQAVLNPDTHTVTCVGAASEEVPTCDWNVQVYNGNECQAIAELVTDGAETLPQDENGEAETSTDYDPEVLCQGYATRYWDCCKAHCAWQGNVPTGMSPIASCDAANQSLGSDASITSACDAPAESSAFACHSGAPWAVSDTLAYGFAAVPGSGDICGRCYELTFDGTGQYNVNDPGSQQLQNKTMVVQATNIGWDVAGGQFDIQIPGGGVGLFDACSYQWGVTGDAMGSQYGGVLTACQQEHGQGNHEAVKICMLDGCGTLFENDPSLAELHDGCMWFVNWYHLADNPRLDYREVPCPEALINVTGMDRTGFNDLQTCDANGSDLGGTDDGGQSCDCSWTSNGTDCGTDDGSVCWQACCGS